MIKGIDKKNITRIIHDKLYKKKNLFYIMKLFRLIRDILKNEVVFNLHLLKWVKHPYPHSKTPLPTFKNTPTHIQSKVIINDIFNNSTSNTDREHRT